MQWATLSRPQLFSSYQHIGKILRMRRKYFEISENLRQIKFWGETSGFLSMHLWKGSCNDGKRTTSWKEI